MEAVLDEKQAGHKPRDQSKAQTVKTRASDEWSGPAVRFDLPRGNSVEIRLRAKLTPKEFEKLKKIFDLSELAFVDDSDIEGVENAWT